MRRITEINWETMDVYVDGKLFKNKDMIPGYRNGHIYVGQDIDSGPSDEAKIIARKIMERINYEG